MLEPLFFEPCLRPQVWGGRRLGTELGRPLPDERTYGESWEVSAHPQHPSRVRGGIFDGHALEDLWRTHRESLSGPDAPDRFPWLLKLLDCQDWLSLQVHPSNEQAARLGLNETGKAEAWVVLEAAPGATMYVGLKPGITSDLLQRCLLDGKVATCLHQVHPRPGDCYHVPPGTLHALGGGLLIVEAQQSSDATFRLFDWNRRGADGQLRPLHVDEVWRTMDWAIGPVSAQRPWALGYTTGARIERLVRNDHFCWDRWTLSQPSALPDQSLSLWTVVGGSGQLIDMSTKRSVSMKLADSVLFPANCRPQLWQPDGTTMLMRLTAGISSGEIDSAADRDTVAASRREILSEPWFGDRNRFAA